MLGRVWLSITGIIVRKMYSSSDEEVLILAALLEENQRKVRKYWEHPIIKKRKQLGEFSRLVRKLQSDEDRFYEYFRMPKAAFEELHQLIANDIRRQTTNYRESISSRERLALTLRFLATGDSYKTIAFSFRIGRSTMSSIVSDVCGKLWEKLQPMYMPFPNKELWEQSAEGFESLWHFPNCIASIDGKHITIQCPKNSGSNFWCYKYKFSIVLLAMVGPNYEFLAVDIGGYGKDSDGGIFERSAIGQRFANQTFNIPHDKPLYKDGPILPHVIVGDQAFSLITYLMRPFPENKVRNDERLQNFNKRLSRARQVVENAFGILINKWRIFLRPMQVEPKTVTKVVQAACCLHNFLRAKKVNNPHRGRSEQLPQEKAMTSLRSIAVNSRRGRNDAFDVRDRFVTYFNSEQGKLPWE